MRRKSSSPKLFPLQIPAFAISEAAKSWTASPSGRKLIRTKKSLQFMRRDRVNFSILLLTVNRDYLSFHAPTVHFTC